MLYKRLQLTKIILLIYFYGFNKTPKSRLCQLLPLEPWLLMQ